jgi:hypothetical protein
VAVCEERDDDAGISLIASGESGLRDCIDGQRDGVILEEHTGVQDAEKIKPVEDASKNKRSNAGVRGKVQELMSPMIRAVALKKKRAPSVRKILKLNARNRKVTEQTSDVNNEMEDEVEGLLKGIKSPSSTEDESVSCASVESKGDDVEVTHVQEHVETEDLVEEIKSKEACDLIENKGVIPSDTRTKNSSEVEINHSLSASSWAAPFTSCLGLDLDENIKSGSKDEVPNGTSAEMNSIDAEISSIQKPAPPVAKSIALDTLLSTDKATGLDKCDASISKSSTLSAQTMPPSPKPESSNEVKSKLYEAPPMPSAPTLSKLPSSLSRASSKDTGNTTADNNVTPSNEPGVVDVDYETEVIEKKTETELVAKKDIFNFMRKKVTEKEPEEHREPKDTGNTTADNNVTPSNEPGVVDVDYETEVIEKKTEAELVAKKDIFNFMRKKVTEKEPEEHREPETMMTEELKGRIVTEKVVALPAPEQFKNESNAKKKTKNKKSRKARKIVQNVEHLFEPSEIPLERTVSDTEVYLVSMAHDDDDVAEAYELVKPATWNGVETKYEDSEDEDDDSVVTHLSGIDDDDFGKRSKCGLADNWHDTLLWWGEAMYNMCPEPNEQGKKSMMENARLYEEAAYVMRDLSRGKL